MIRFVDVPQSCLRFGIAVGDITPPVGIYCRMWGAARHDQATGVHRPLRASAMVLGSAEQSAAEQELVLIALDHCSLRAAEMDRLLESVSESTGIALDKLLVLFSHTHAAGLISRDRAAMPGGGLIAPDLDQLAKTVAGLVREARRQVQPAQIVYGSGRCDLAVQRDYWDEQSQQYVCGYNPQGIADDTVVVARVCEMDGRTLATLVNYACHPTTLAWENTLISPDFPGAMREVMEEATAAPCVFLQGASGDLAPKHGYVGDPGIADRNGRQLGYAALSVLTSMPPAGKRFTYAGPVISGATLGTWQHETVPASRQAEIDRWQLCQTTVTLPYRGDMPGLRQVREDLARWENEEAAARQRGEVQQVGDCRARAERSRRRAMMLEQLPSGDAFPLPVTVLRLGDALWVAVEGEHYQQLQTALRKRFPDRSLVVATLANGSRPMYLVPREAYGKGIYQEVVAPLAPGCLETVIEAIVEQIDDMLAPQSSIRQQ